jgi:Fur family peroxide stress response transcriptional regulator
LVFTKQRQLILDAVMASTTHPTANELFQTIHPKMPTISLATVYRNLNLLSENGQIRKIEMPGMPDRYDWRMETHDHLWCEKCGQVFDFTLPQALDAQIQQVSGMKVRQYTLVAHGLCCNCQKQQSQNL